MGLYDYPTPDIASNLAPPQYRNTKFLAWLTALLYPLQWLRDLFFDSYVSGFSGAVWHPGTYPKGTRVRFSGNPTVNTAQCGIKIVYEAQVNTSSNPAVGTDWMPVQRIWVGADARAAYNSQKLILEYAINQWFDTTFRQPDDPISPTHSDIYITEDDTNNDLFIAGDILDASAASGDNGLIDGAVGDDNSFIGNISRTINVPTVVYNALGVHRDNIIGAFVDQYNLAGVLYNIKTY